MTARRGAGPLAASDADALQRVAASSKVLADRLRVTIASHVDRQAEDDAASVQLSALSTVLVGVVLGLPVPSAERRAILGAIQAVERRALADALRAEPAHDPALCPDCAGEAASDVRAARAGRRGKVVH